MGQNVEPVIEIEAMRFCYREGRYVLDGVDLSVAKGESVGIIGGNGAGKSTFLKILWAFCRIMRGGSGSRDFCWRKRITVRYAAVWAMSFRIPTASFL